MFYKEKIQFETEFCVLYITDAENNIDLYVTLVFRSWFNSMLRTKHRFALNKWKKKTALIKRNTKILEIRCSTTGKLIFHFYYFLSLTFRWVGKEAIRTKIKFKIYQTIIKVVSVLWISGIRSTSLINVSIMNTRK